MTQVIGNLGHRVMLLHPLCELLFNGALFMKLDVAQIKDDTWMNSLCESTRESVEIEVSLRGATGEKEKNHPKTHANTFSPASPIVITERDTWHFQF